MVSMNLAKAYQISEENKKTYNEVADDFYQTRRKYSPEIEELKAYTIEGEKVLDLGCGTGRLYEIFKDKNTDYTGIDFSEKLIHLAREKYRLKFIVGDILNLPFSEEKFDSVWAIAVLHHIPSKELRGRAIAEIKRVLKPNGRVIVACWKIKSFLRKNLFIPFRGKKRYYYAFSKKELEKLFQDAGFKIEESRYFKRGNKKTNIFIVARLVVK